MRAADSRQRPDGTLDRGVELYGTSRPLARWRRGRGRENVFGAAKHCAYVLAAIGLAAVTW